MNQEAGSGTTPPLEERDARIARILSEGIERSEKAYAQGQYPEDYGYIIMDRMIIGQPLTLAHALLRRGDADSVSRAAEIITSILDLQETHPRHPHRGNWPRFVGEEDVTDLNSAPFILRWFIPLLRDHQHQLPSDLRARCLEALRLALEEIERIDVGIIYTNIRIKADFALIVGGQLLEDARLQQVGQARWAEWVRFTVDSGAPREYNSLTYMGMNLAMLAKLQEMADDPVVRLQARLMYERFWLHAILHVHRPTRQLAGPHARCYWTPMVTGRERFTEILWRETGWPWLLEPGPYSGDPADVLPGNIELALTHHWLPPFAASWILNQPSSPPYEVRETASVGEGHDITTYMTPSYALGTASRTYSTDTECWAIERMANHLMLHYARPGKPGGWGMMYARYVVNDQHWGTLGSFAFRPTTNFFDQGHFAGVQLRNKAIALYALMPVRGIDVSSLKTVVAFQSADLDRIWVNGRRVTLEEIPCTLNLGDWLIVEDGAVYVGVRALEPSCLRWDTPIMLERGPLGEVWLTIYNYRGERKRFWDYDALGGPYWQGNLKAGFVVEVAERTEYPSAHAFLAHLAKAEIDDVADQAKVRTVTYHSGGDEIAIRYDLWNTEPKERYLNGALYQPPHLASPLAVQGASGDLRVGRARLVTDPQMAWLIAHEGDPDLAVWIAVNPLGAPTPVRLETPRGVVRADAWGMGRLEWRAYADGRQVLIVDGLSEPVGLQVPEGVEVRTPAGGGA